MHAVHTTYKEIINLSLDLRASIEPEHSELQINDSSNTGSMKEDESLLPVEQSAEEAEEESSCRESNDDAKEMRLNDDSPNEQNQSNDVLVIEIESGATPADKDEYVLSYRRYF